jgi:hypothetical protein
MELLRPAAPDSSGRRSADPTPCSCGRQLSSQDARMRGVGAHRSSRPAGRHWAGSCRRRGAASARRAVRGEGCPAAPEARRPADGQLPPVRLTFRRRASRLPCQVHLAGLPAS